MARQFIYHMQGLTQDLSGRQEGPREHQSLLLSRRQDRRARRQRLRQIDAAADHGRASTRSSPARASSPRARGSAICRRSRSSTRRSTCAAMSCSASPAKKAILDRYNDLAMNYSDETADEMTKLQDEIEAKGLWDLDSQVDQAMDALGCPPDDAGRRQALRRRAAPRRALPAAARTAGTAAARRADQPSRRRNRQLARRPSARLSRRDPDRHPRPLFPRQCHRLDSRTRSRPRHPLRGQLLGLAEAEAEAPRAGRPRGRGAPARARSRERMDRRLAQGAAGQIQGPHPALRGTRRQAERQGADDRADRHSGRRAARRQCHRVRPSRRKASATSC